MLSPVPSTLIVPLPGLDPPDDADVRRRLSRAFPDWEEMEVADEEFQFLGGLSWMVSARIPGLFQPVYIWVEEADELPEDAWWVSTDIQPEEQEAYDDCAFALVVETTLSSADPRQLWKVQLSVALALAEDAPFLYDDSAIRILSLPYAESLVETPSAPSAREMMSLHAVYDEDDGGRLWMHSHGLARAGVADVEMLQVLRHQRTVASQLLGHVADRQMDDGLAAGKSFQVNPSIRLNLVELEEALDWMAPDALGSEWDRDEYHAPPRLLLTAPESTDRDGFSFLPRRRNPFVLDALLASLERDELIYYTEAEVRRMAYLSRYRWPVFLSLWRQRRGRDWTFLVKAAFDAEEADAPVEHLWFEVVALEPEEMEGVLVNRPLRVADLRAGDRLTLSPEHVTDWSVATDDGAYTPGNIVPLALRAGVLVGSSKKVH